MLLSARSNAHKEYGKVAPMHIGGGKPIGRLALVLMAPALVATTGCSSSSSGKAPEIDAPVASAHAMDQFDANKDGAIEISELADCPALAAALPSFDSSGDGRLEASEIAKGLEQMYASRKSLTEMTCTVTLKGRTLVGANVRLRPLEMLSELPPAEGVTDESGTVHPAVSADLVPTEFKHKALMYPGLYRVEITHDQSQLPGRYNTATELGCQVNPVARDGMAARFDLK